jgi:hypothetical protein
MHIPIPQPDNATTPRAQVQSIYLIFDSHPRPNHPNGAAVQIFPARPTDDVADYLTDLFQVDDTLINDPNLQWHVQLLGQVSYHLIAPATTRQILNEYALNMQFLTLHHRLNETQRKLRDEEAENRQLRSKNFDLEQEVAMSKFTERRKNEEIQQLKSQSKRAPSSPPKDSSWFSSSKSKNTDKGKRREDTHSQHTGSKPGTSGFEFSPWNRAPERSRTLPAPPKSHAGSSASHRAAGPSHHQKSESEVDDPELMRSLELAMAMQREFDEERYAFSLDESLARTVERPKFDCGICMESFTDEAIALVEGCGHSCCRDCMRSNIQSKIEERRYPIPCPFCVAGSDTPASPGAGVGGKFWLLYTGLPDTNNVVKSSRIHSLRLLE